MIKRALVAGTGAVLALSMGAATAYFTAQVQVPDSIIKAGSVAVSAEPTSAPLSVEGLAPGVSVKRSLTVSNKGTMPADVIVTTSKKAGITKFYEALECTVTCGSTGLYKGSLSSMRTAPLRLASGAKGEIKFEVGMPTALDNTYSDDYAKISLYVDAEQSH